MRYRTLLPLALVFSAFFTLAVADESRAVQTDRC